MSVITGRITISVLRVGLIILLFQRCVWAKEYFNPHLLETSDTSVPAIDLSLFTQDNVPPGDYNLDIYINGHYVDSRTLTFRKDVANNEVRACLDTTLLKQWNIRTDHYPQLAKAGDPCAQLSVIPDVKAHLDIARQRYELSVPQIAMLTTVRGYVSEDRWDEGITAGLLNYSLSGQNVTPRKGGDSDSSQFLSIQPGLNVGPWRLRNYSTWNHDDDRQNWDSVYTYLSRDIHALRSQMVIGESNTQTGIFDSTSFTGVMLYSDTEMLPDSQQGFAPVVRGIARTNADVSVYQNGYVIYKTTVSPGNFAINDIYPTGSSGDLQVVVKESDGSEHRFVVPYASLAVLQREGQGRYSVVMGKTRHESSRTHEFNFVQASAARGVGGGLTLFSGLIQAEDKYTNLLFGAGVNLGEIGAVSLDISQAWAQLNVDKASETPSHDDGQSYRLRYSKTLQATDTTLSLAGYRYSSSGYYSFQDFSDNWNEGDDLNDAGRERNRFDVSLSQNTDWGTLAVSLISESYWDESRMDSLNIGYSNNIGKLSYFVNYAHNKNFASENDDDGATNDDAIAVTFSLPFSAFSNDERWQSVSANYAVNSDGDNHTTHTLGLTGSLLKDNALNWQVSEGYDSSSKNTNGNLNLSYQSSYADLSAGYGYDEYNQRYSYGVRGGAVVHSKGVTLSRALNESIALVQAPGVANLPVAGQANIHTDWFGNAVIPYVRPYHVNDVTLDSSDASIANADMDNMDKKLVPTRGAVVLARYQTWLGYKSMMTLNYHGKAVPFGAVVTSEENDNDAVRTNIVGDDGQVYLVGLKAKGVLHVKWGVTPDKQCRVNYALPKADPQNNILFYRGQCLAVPVNHG
ncbi:fimbria/pilus outer membrane usher protein [Leclercia adecarboxylata]|uniref:fimbria/pilus outer membrane usher protein n=1 Tax=Leclercia adecarboxylata TaxID=83655 RepID=UPI00384D9B05